MQGRSSATDPAVPCATLALAGWLAILVAATGCTPGTTSEFEELVVDDNMAGDCKAVADLDGDGLPDLVVAGGPDEGMRWYRNPHWQSEFIAAPKTEFTTDMAAADLDGDGDMDLVVPDGPNGCNLLWFENRLNSVASESGWTRHCLGTAGDWVKDVELADLNTDGRVDVAARTRGALLIFYQAGLSWNTVRPDTGDLGGEGMAAGDINGDGLDDLFFGRLWLENPGTDDLPWKRHDLDDSPQAVKTVIADLNGDGRADLLTSASELEPGPVSWREQTEQGRWIRHNLIDSLEGVHTLETGDVDSDGDTDIVIAQMHTVERPEIHWLVNNLPAPWAIRNLASTGLHNGVLADLDRDGDPDLFGANWTGHPPVRLWRNRLTPRPKGWSTKIISSDQQRTFGLGFGDVDQDGYLDVASGHNLLLQRRTENGWTWRSLPLADGLQAFGTLGRAAGGHDVLAQSQDAQLKIWTMRYETTDRRLAQPQLVAKLPPASHAQGSQGYRFADLNADGHVDVAVASAGGLFVLFQPQVDGAPWRKIMIGSQTSDEGIAIGDMDGDGAPDLAATSGESKEVMWFRNPGSANEPWSVERVATLPTAVYLDRLELADFDRDGQLDIVVSEENGRAEGAHVYWFSRASGGWQQHLLTIQGSTNSLSVADLDADGWTDIVTAEHRGELRTIFWRNDGRGNFRAQQLAAGLEAHLGARPVDLDADGDLDLVSIGWDDPTRLWMLQNEHEWLQQ